MDCGRTLSSSCSDLARSSSSKSRERSRWRVLLTSNRKTTTDGPMTFIMKKVVVRSTDGGLAGATPSGSTPASISPATMTSAMNAANQPEACRRPANSIAPTGEVNDHRTTPLELTKPPRTSMSATGNSSVTSNWVKRKRW